MTETNTLEREIDITALDFEPASAPPPRRAGFFRGARKWRNRAIVLLMVAAAAFGTVRLIQHRAAGDYKLAVDDVVLTSNPIDISFAQTGVVTGSAVSAGDHVVAGEHVGEVAVTTTNAAGHTVVVHRTLRAPHDGIVVTDPMSVGSTLLAGSTFLEMYDPNALELVTTVPLSYLPKIGRGMSADLTAPGVPGTVHAAVERAVPRVGNTQPGVAKGSVQLVFRPEHREAIANLLPGLRFHGYVDTRTARGDHSRAQYVGSS